MYYLLNTHPPRAAADFKTDDEPTNTTSTYTDMDATGSGWQSWAQEYPNRDYCRQADRNMEPNTEYLVYAYGVDPITIERLTPISKKTLTTLAPQTIDTKFDIQIVSDRRSQHRRSCQSERLRRPFCRKDLRQRRCGRYGCDRFGENIGKLDRQRTRSTDGWGWHGRNDPEPIYLSTIQRNPGNARTELQILHLCLCRR